MDTLPPPRRRDDVQLLPSFPPPVFAFHRHYHKLLPMLTTIKPKRDDAQEFMKSLHRDLGFELPET